MIYYLYTLEHPITNEVRYVGKTINIKRRYKQHLYDKRSSHKASWVKSLKNDSLKPIMTIIEECTIDTWQEREIYWITQFDNLTNHLNGGGVNYVRTTKQETRDKLSAIHKNKKLTEKHKDKIKKSINKKPCLINNLYYESTMEASRKIGIPSSTIYSRIISENFNDYIWFIQ